MPSLKLGILFAGYIVVLNTSIMEDKLEFKVGDIVVLKSGGPDMTIEEYPTLGTIGEDYTKAKCVWFNKNELYHSIFPISTLEKDE